MMIDNLPPHLARKVRYRSDEASEYLELMHGIVQAASTLDRKRSTGGGPAFQKGANRACFYRREDLDAWANGYLSAPVHSTSELPADTP